MTVTTIDAKYLGHEEFVSTYLLQHGGRAAFIETANAAAVPRMLERLSEMKWEKAGQEEYGGPPGSEVIAQQACGQVQIGAEPGRAEA